MKLEELRVNYTYPNNVIETSRYLISDSMEIEGDMYYDIDEDSRRSIKQYTPDETEFANAIYRLFTPKQRIFIGHHYKYMMGLKDISINTGVSYKRVHKEFMDVIYILKTKRAARMLFGAAMAGPDQEYWNGKIIPHEYDEMAIIRDLDVDDSNFRVKWQALSKALTNANEDKNPWLEKYGVGRICDMTISEFISIDPYNMGKIYGLGCIKMLIVLKVFDDCGFSYAKQHGFESYSDAISAIFKTKNIKKSMVYKD